MAVTKLFYIGSELASAPPFTKRFYVDTAGKKCYLSMGTAAATDWAEIQMVQRMATLFTTDQTLVAGDNGKILVFAGASLDVTLPVGSTLTPGWKVTIVNENAFISQADSATIHTTTVAATPIGQRNLLIKRASTDTVNGVSTQFHGVALIVPPRECVDIWYTPSGQFEASPSITVGWRDNPLEASSLGVGTKDPAESQVGAAFYRGLEFDDAVVAFEKEVYGKIHINHDYVPGTKVYLHLHFDSGNTTATSVVRWGFQYTVAKGHGQQAFSPTGTTVYANQTLNGTPYTHYVTEVSDTNAVAATNLEPDSIIKVRYFRNSSDAADTFTGSVWLDKVDAHYLSTDGGTPLKAPPFYL